MPSFLSKSPTPYNFVSCIHLISHYKPLSGVFTSFHETFPIKYKNASKNPLFDVFKIGYPLYAFFHRKRNMDFPCSFWISLFCTIYSDGLCSIIPAYSNIHQAAQVTQFEVCAAVNGVSRHCVFHPTSVYRCSGR